MNVPTVSVTELHNRLGFSNPLDYPESSLSKPLTEWKMEVDDAPIFRYLYRNFRPRRHLEFGTWQGTGVLYCLEESEATVWTINLLGGEYLPDGSWAYYSGFPVPPSTSIISRLLSWAKRQSLPLPSWSKKKRISKDCCRYQTDSLGFIGRYYLERGLGYRVCQIYCGSHEWDISNYPKEFFDTALVDGGHTKDLVTNDTRMACQLIRSGGLIMWHDFCPKAEVYDKCPSTKGVLNAIRTNWDWLTGQMKDIFWVNPSWILLGVKK